VGRPSKPNRKVSITLRLDREVVERFKATGAAGRRVSMRRCERPQQADLPAPPFGLIAEDDQP
jgi:hypothetical protein